MHTSGHQLLSTVINCYHAASYLRTCVAQCFNRATNTTTGASNGYINNYTGYRRAFRAVSIASVTQTVDHYIRSIGRRINDNGVIGILHNSGTRSLDCLGPRDLLSFNVLSRIPRTHVHSILDRVTASNFLAVTRKHLPVINFKPHTTRAITPRFRCSVGGVGHTSTHTHQAPSISAPTIKSCIPSSNSRTLFRGLHTLQLSVTHRLNGPPCVIFSSGALHSVMQIGPVASSRFLTIGNIKRDGLGRCNRQFVTTVQRSSNSRT